MQADFICLTETRTETRGCNDVSPFITESSKGSLASTTVSASGLQGLNMERFGGGQYRGPRRAVGAIRHLVQV